MLGAHHWNIQGHASLARAKLGFFSILFLHFCGIFLNWVGWVKVFFTHQWGIPSIRQVDEGFLLFKNTSPPPLDIKWCAPYLIGRRETWVDVCAFYVSGKSGYVAYIIHRTWRGLQGEISFCQQKEQSVTITLSWLWWIVCML